MHSAQETWLLRLRQLRPNVNLSRGSGAARFAPHKPLLLLALLDLAGTAGEAPQEFIKLDADLRIRFLESWAVVVQRWGSKPDIHLPFFHLSSQGFWSPLQANGQPAQDAHSTVALKLHPEFSTLLSQPNFRVLAAQVLIHTWFPVAEQIGLYSLYDTVPGNNSLLADLAQAAVVAAKGTGRDARFRIQVITRYSYTCALSGYTLTTADGATMVEAAHIADFATSHNNDPQNGLALTPNAHWSFDERLWTVDEKLRVVVSRQRFVDHGPAGQSLAACHGQPLFFHPRSNLRPDESFLAQHRAKFVG